MNEHNSCCCCAQPIGTPEFTTRTKREQTKSTKPRTNLRSTNGKTSGLRKVCQANCPLFHAICSHCKCATQRHFSTNMAMGLPAMLNFRLSILSSHVHTCSFPSAFNTTTGSCLCIGVWNWEQPAWPQTCMMRQLCS